MGSLDGRTVGDMVGDTVGNGEVMTSRQVLLFAWLDIDSMDC